MWTKLKSECLKYIWELSIYRNFLYSLKCGRWKIPLNTIRLLTWRVGKILFNRKVSSIQRNLLNLVTQKLDLWHWKQVIPGMEPTSYSWFNLGKFLQNNEMKSVLVNPHHVKKQKNSTIIIRQRAIVKIRKPLQDWFKRDAIWFHICLTVFMLILEKHRTWDVSYRGNLQKFRTGAVAGSIYIFLSIRRYMENRMTKAEC